MVDDQGWSLTGDGRMVPGWGVPVGRWRDEATRLAGSAGDRKRRQSVDALACAAEEGRGHATKRLGELRASRDPRVSEWGNPAGVIPRHCQVNA